MNSPEKQIPDEQPIYVPKSEIMVGEDGLETYGGFPLPPDNSDDFGRDGLQQMRLRRNSDQYPQRIERDGYGQKVVPVLTNKQARLANLMSIDSTGLPLFMLWDDIKEDVYANRTEVQKQQDEVIERMLSTYETEQQRIPAADALMSFPRDRRLGRTRRVRLAVVRTVIESQPKHADQDEN